MSQLYTNCAVNDAVRFPNVSNRNAAKQSTMLQGLLAWVLCLIIAFALPNKASANYVTYNGFEFDDTQDLPKFVDGVWEISSAKDLAIMAWMVNTNANYANADFRLTADIDFSIITDLEGISWTPIGNKYAASAYNNSKHSDIGNVPSGAKEGYFSGTFDGGDHTISGLYIDNGITTAGLFGVAFGGEIKDLKLANVNIRGGNLTGALVGYAIPTEDGVTGGIAITNCQVLSGVVRGKSEVGGLVGWSNGVINNVTNYANVSASDQIAGGIAGGQECNALTYAANYSEVKAVNGHAGGVAGTLLGKNDRHAVQGAVNFGAVSGTDFVGGIVGEANGQVKINSNANVGAVSGADYVGGIAGTVRNSLAGSGTSSELSVCLNRGVVSGANYVSGIANSNAPAGTYDGKITNNINSGKVYGASNVGQISATELNAYSTNNIYDKQNTYDYAGTAAGDVDGRANGYNTTTVISYMVSIGMVNTNPVNERWRTLNSVAYPIPAMLYSSDDKCRTLAISEVVIADALNTDSLIDKIFALQRNLSNQITGITWSAQPTGIATLSAEGGNRQNVNIVAFVQGEDIKNVACIINDGGNKSFQMICKPNFNVNADLSNNNAVYIDDMGKNGMMFFEEGKSLAKLNLEDNSESKFIRNSSSEKRSLGIIVIIIILSIIFVVIITIIIIMFRKKFTKKKNQENNESQITSNNETTNPPTEASKAKI